LEKGSGSPGAGVVDFTLVHAPRRVVVPGIGPALGTRLGIARIEDGVEIVVVALECSGFFEAPMSPLLHGSTPVR